jgi:hypothetical protein
MKTVPVMILALVAMATPSAAFTPRVLHTQTASRIFGLGAIPGGWKGGFSESNPAYAYPEPRQESRVPDVSDLPILDNLANIPLLTRQQRVQWPQFSWLTVEGNEDSRVYQMFAPNISRLGYTDDGRVYSIICPQQGFGSEMLGEMNIEVTVTGNRGWVNEPEKDVYAEMGVEGKIWFSGRTNKRPIMLKLLERVLRRSDFPFSKDQAILVSTNMPNDPSTKNFPLINGTNPEFPIPNFGRHDVDAYGVAHLNVEIGKIHKTGVEKIDAFNELVINIFNLGAGNIFKEKSVLSWNVWFEEPELVDQGEWADHAEYWRKSLMVNHTSPGGNEGSDQQYFDGTLFEPLKLARRQLELELIEDFIEKHADHKTYIEEFHDFLNEEGMKTPFLDKLEDIKDQFEDRVESRFEKYEDFKNNIEDRVESRFEEIFKRFK